MPTTDDDFRRRLLDLLDELWPFALAYFHPLIDGRVETREHLAKWFSTFYIKDTGVVLARTYTKCPHLDARSFIAENLFEEEGRGRAERSHAELSKRLPRYFGTSDEELEATHSRWLRNAQSRGREKIAAQEDWLEDFAGFGLASEFYAPAIFEQIVDRLRDEFELPEEVLEFFNVHLDEDVDHARRTFEIVLRYARTAEEQERVVQAVRRHILGEAGAMGGETPAPLSDELVTRLRTSPRANPLDA